MIRKKERIKGQTYDKFGRLIDCETEVEEITCECVGDILDVLADCSRGATVFMIPPEKGDSIQRVQVFDCCEVEQKLGEEVTLHGVGFRKAFAFTIGGHGPFEMVDCYKKQLERENNKKPIVLTEQQMSDVENRFFEYDCFAVEDNVFMIDGPISVQTILDAADYIRTLNTN